VFELYLDPFVGIDEAVRSRVVSNCGGEAQEGWERNSPDVELFVGYATGALLEAEYFRTAFADVEDATPPNSRH
jgi:hypothetical protein